ncbi:hypothetical protein JZ751_009442, partial [Albula glossodonta]
MDRCNNLHVCQYFLQDNCNYGAGCKRAHNFSDSAVKILTSRGVSLSTRKKETECTQTPSVPPKVSCEELFRALPNPNLIYCPLGSPAAPPAAPVVKERSHHQSSASIIEADSNEICLFYIRGSCSFEEKCTRVHHQLPYRWQVLNINGNTWNDLTNMESIEQAYCNPAKDSSELSPQVNFLTMTSGYSKVRRLSTASSVNKPPHFILTTDWLWYWKNDKGGWSEFGTEPDAKTRSSITSKDLEKVYQTNTGIDIHITAGKNRYLVLIKDMFQQNITTKKKREIRRRPRFVSGQEVEKKLKSGTSEAAGSSTMTIPEQWDKKALPEYGYKLIPLSDSSTDFQQVAQLFKRTMYQSTIRSIQRIQNPSLYRVFQWFVFICRQKEQMQLRTGGRVVEQKLLFHGTEKSFMPAICEQNFDWRICGTNGTAYGKGKNLPGMVLSTSHLWVSLSERSYFARDASYSDKYSKPKCVPKSMFGVQVLVGEYTKGASSYKRPPPNYDSCVDSVNNPAIFVIFEKYQIYPEIKCKNSHDLCSPHNVQVLRTQGLQELTPPALFQLLLQNDSYLLPEICSHYNRGNGEHGSCRFTDRCTSLHVCQHFLQDDCKFGAMCKRAHKFDAAAMKILNGRGISLENLRVLQSIYRIRFTISGHTDGPAVPGLSTRKKETEFTGTPAAPPAVPVVKERFRQRSGTSISEADINEICLFFIRRGCSFKEKCVRVHYHLPYKWQIVDRDGTTWKDLPDMESVEQAYCNPAKNSSDGISQVDFLTMTSGASKVRRLSTASSVTKPPHFILTTDWLWYWKNDEGAWSEFGTEADAKAKASITSQTLENVYVAGADEVPFCAGKQTYTLNFKGRDPWMQKFSFILGTSEASGSSAMTVPAYWDKEALSEFSYKLVAQLFKQTMQKEQMQGRNGGKAVEQKLLFHGTEKSLMPAICEQNFDWRICGTNGTLYGKGKHQPITVRSYFARDASYSNSYSSDKSMFGVQVLVGEYTKGNSSYLRPPPKESEQGFYDSCVDSMTNPAIFVVFEKQQIYPEIKCKNSHDLCSPHNVQVLRTQGLQELTPPALFQLLLQNDSYLLPEICSHYNRGNGEHGSCRFTDRCTSLHVCQHFLQDDCKFGAMCKRAHKFDAAAMKILNGRGISPENLRVLQSIYRIRFTISGHTDGPAGLSTRKKETEFTGTPAAPPAVPVVKERFRQRSGTSISEADINEICLFFIRRGCSFKEKCVRVHYHLPYKWQIVDRDGTTWKDLPDMESVEQAYCNPAKNSSDGISQVDFLTMTSGASKVRRLSTASSVTKPPHFILTTDWLWYWKNDEGAWSEFGTEADAKAKASITSQTLENVYVAGADEVPFCAGKQTYTLNFKGRDPWMQKFSSILGTSEASGSSTMSIPAHWDKEALPDFNYKAEYTPIGQKEQMQGRNGGKAVEQKLLFHGTEKSLMPAICEQNFDWRICGVHGTHYGKGKHQPITVRSYFARDAAYSDRYSKSSDRGTKSMFVVQVLVGDYTKGDRSYLRPPPKESEQGFYDSCVDSVTNPAIFVIFEKHQIYPEYIIEYSDGSE